MPALAPFLVLFFVSGACGLVYEVVWSRLLGLAVGHTTVALTAVVAAYMGGLALGSAGASRHLRRGADAVLMYAGLEVGIAALAALFPVQLAVVTRLSALSGEWLARGSVALAVVRFALAALAVVPATTLMGGTLPAMLDAVPRGAGSATRAAGWLYAVNTAGAMAGAALAGFILIERFGTFEATWLAAAGNLCLAVAVVLASRGRAARVQPQRSALIPPPVARDGRDARGPATDLPVLVGYAISGFASLTCQLAWTRALVFFAGSTTYAFSSMLVVFLGGVALGTAGATPIVDRVRQPDRMFLLLQVALAVSAAASLRLLQSASRAIDTRWNPELSWASLVTSGFLKAVVTMGLPTVLMGALFPVAVRMMLQCRVPDAGEPSSRGADLGRLYAVNTAGSILGATCAGLLLLPLLGIRGTLLAACAASLCAALVVGHAERRHVVHLAWLVPALMVCAWLVRGTALHATGGSEQLVFYEEGTSATVSVLQEVTGTRTIYIDRVPVAGTDTIMLTDQKSLAHVPMLLHPSATRVLTVGFGSGGASWSFTRYRGLQRVDAVEIDPTVFRAAPHLQDSNHRVWEDPRFHLILEDARNYLASTTARYDIISTDCTDLRYKSNANLYTVDYFTLARDRLNPGGLVTVWMPLGGLGGDTFRMALRTFRAVFPQMTVWYMTNQPTHYLLLVGSDQPIRPSLERVSAAMADAQVRTDLAEIRLDDPLKIASSLLLDAGESAALAGDGPLNTDRHPYLEFEAPRLAYRDALATNLRAVMAARHPERGTAPWADLGVRAPSLTRYVAATPALVEGHARYQMGSFDYDGALRLYRAAARINPDDPSVPPLVADVERTRGVWLAEFTTRTSKGSRDVRDWLALALLLRQAGRLDEAARAAERATMLEPRLLEPWLRLAAIYSARGTPSAAVATLERARALQPEDPVLLSDLGAAFNDEARFADAEPLLRRSLGIRPTAEAHNNLGVTLNGLNRPADAVHEFGAALALNRGAAEAWFNLGVSHAMLGDAEQARTAYRNGLALMPGEPRALANLAMMEAQFGRLDLTVTYLREALAAGGPSAPLLNDLGRAYLGLGRADLARAVLEQAQALDPRSRAILENLALARAAQDRQPVH